MPGDELKYVTTMEEEKAVVISLLQINLCSQKAWYMGIEKALIGSGHSLLQREEVNVYDALPCTSAVRKKIKDLA